MGRKLRGTFEREEIGRKIGEGEGRMGVKRRGGWGGGGGVRAGEVL